MYWPKLGLGVWVLLDTVIINIIKNSFNHSKMILDYRSKRDNIVFEKKNKVGL